MKFKLSLPLLLILLAGCGILGIPPADTFNKRVVLANSAVEAVASTVDTLYTAGKISQADASSVLKQTTEARTGIEIARGMYATNPVDAENRLTTIITALDALNRYLGAKQ
jgi:hypothetical protein